MTNTATETPSVPAKKGASKEPSRLAKKAVTKPRAAKAAKPQKPAAKPSTGKAAKPALLSGGNPQIAKGYGDAPV